MPTLEIDIPEQTLAHLDMEPSALALAMKTMAALKMYELGSALFAPGGYACWHLTWGVSSAPPYLPNSPI